MPWGGDCTPRRRVWGGSQMYNIQAWSEEEEGLHGVFKRLRRNGHQLKKGSCKQFNTDCHS
jgi:hypothetical protein